MLGLLVGVILFHKPSGIFLGDSIEVPSITPVPKERIADESTSIDGIKKLTMRTIKQDDAMVSYTFLINDGEKEFTLFKATAKEGTFVVPSNSWSPDSMYVFLIDTASLPEQIYVFKASGESFSDEQQYLNVTELFSASKQQHIVDTATGWDSRGLLHIRTKNQDDSRGPSYWFDVYSRSFIQLAAR